MEPCTVSSNSGQEDGSSEQTKHPLQRTRRKVGEKKEKTEEEVLRNRLIQAKYRQRVKDRRELLVAQYEAACADLEREQQQVLDLTATNSALEAVLSLRNDWTAALEEAGGSTPQGSVVCAEASNSVLHQLITPYPYTLVRPPCDLRTASSSGLSSAGSKDIDMAAPNQEEGVQQAAAAAAAAHPAVVLPEAAAAALPAASTAVGAPPAIAAGAGPTPSLLPVDPITAAANKIGTSLAEATVPDGDGVPDASTTKQFDPISVMQGMQIDPEVVEGVRAATPEQFIRSWVDFVSKTRDVLTQCDLTKSEPSYVDLKVQMEQWGVLLAVVLIHNPGNLQRLLAAQLGGQQSEEEECKQWDAVLASLDLTQAQREHYLQLLSAYERQVELLRKHKAHALQLVRQGTIDPVQLKSMGMNLRMAAYLRVWEGLEALHVYPDMVFIATLELLGSITLEWTPLQKARLLAGAGPSFPNIFGLLNAIKRAAQAIPAAPAHV